MFPYGEWVWVPRVNEEGIGKGGDPVWGGKSVSDVDCEKGRNKITES